MKTLTGEEIQTAAAETLHIDFASLIALSAIWAPVEEHVAAHDGQGNFARIPNCRRKRHFEPRGEVDGIIYDDNSRPNSQMKSMARKYYGVSLQDFTVCHVWPDTCYDVRYHTCYANLVCIPAAIHSLTDYDGEHIGWVLIALQSVFYQILHADSFKAALVDIVSAGGDTDTNAAIAGALLGLLYGVRAIPRKWITAVRMANNPCYTALLPLSKPASIH